MSSVEYACLEFGENVEKMLDIQDFVQFCFECTHYYKSWEWAVRSFGFYDFCILKFEWSGFVRVGFEK